MAYTRTYNPCDDCQYAYSKNGQESSVCKICEFEELRTADVVPRSEVEKLEEHIDDLNDSKEHLCVMLGEARADVAREIFEEIEEIIDSHEITIGLVYDEGAGATTAIDRINKKIAELKKKYTEGE